MSAMGADLIRRGEELLDDIGIPNTEAAWEWAMNRLMTESESVTA